MRPSSTDAGPGILLTGTLLDQATFATLGSVLCHLESWLFVHVLFAAPVGVVALSSVPGHGREHESEPRRRPPGLVLK